jgi:hypothetical protein
MKKIDNSMKLRLLTITVCIIILWLILLTSKDGVVRFFTAFFATMMTVAYIAFVVNVFYEKKTKTLIYTSPPIKLSFWRRFLARLPFFCSYCGKYYVKTKNFITPFPPIGDYVRCCPDAHEGCCKSFNGCCYEKHWVDYVFLQQKINLIEKGNKNKINIFKIKFEGGDQNYKRPYTVDTRHLTDSGGRRVAYFYSKRLAKCATDLINEINPNYRANVVKLLSMTRLCLWRIKIEYKVRKFLHLW